MAVSLSDMAAMGAQPKWVLLNLSLPESDETWCQQFIDGFAALLHQHQVQLIGGDTTQGSLSVTVTVMGEAAKPIRRDQAQANDLIAVSGVFGSAAFALNNPDACQSCLQQLQMPEPRLDLVERIKNLATSMIDVSDGLVADLGHICQASELGAVIELSQIPINEIIKTDQQWMQYVLAGGDDYQLCFTINQADEDLLPQDCHIIGQMITGDSVTVLNNHQPLQQTFQGYQHFNS